jgi:hypothetical protein
MMCIALPKSAKVKVHHLPLEHSQKDLQCLDSLASRLVSSWRKPPVKKKTARQAKSTTSTLYGPGAFGFCMPPSPRYFMSRRQVACDLHISEKWLGVQWLVSLVYPRGSIQGSPGASNVAALSIWQTDHRNTRSGNMEMLMLADSKITITMRLHGEIKHGLSCLTNRN